jgi:hypothetical protein
MTASLETLVIAAYIFADAAIPRPGPKGKVTDAELVALTVCQAAVGIPSDRQFLGLVERLLPGWFPCPPDQSQYNRRLRRLTPWSASAQLRVAELIAEGQVRLADGTLLRDRLHRLEGAAPCPAQPGSSPHLDIEQSEALGFGSRRFEPLI